MWYALLFGASLLGLVVLFGLKAFELARNVKTPLQHIRRVGDPILVEGWVHYSGKCRKAMLAGARIVLLWVRSGVQKTHVKFDATMHLLATRLNKYLRTRRLHRHHGSEVSTHLKTVLEKTEQKASESDAA